MHRKLKLLEPTFYVPFRHGRYDVAPGLVKFGKGDCAADAHVCQLDMTFEDVRRVKMAVRGEDLGKYYCTHELSEDVRREVTSFIVRRLVEHPQWFGEATVGDSRKLQCALTGERLRFDQRMRLIGAGGAYVDALDALACQVQEDRGVVSTDGTRHWLSAAHVCLPNGWAPGEKVGGTFAGIHEPVAGMGEMNR